MFYLRDQFAVDRRKRFFFETSSRPNGKLLRFDYVLRVLQGHSHSHLLIDGSNIVFEFGSQLCGREMHAQ